MLTLLGLVAGVLVLSGFFSGAEAALLSVTQAEVETFMRDKVRGASILQSIKNNQNRSVIAIVILNNTVNIVGSILVGQVAMREYGDATLAIVTTGLTFGVIIFSEIIPKSLGMHYAHKMAIPVAIAIRAITMPLLPIIILLEMLTSLLHRGERKVGTEQDIRSLVTLGRQAGHIESDEGQLIHRAFILNDKTAADIMTPLKDITSFTHTDLIEEVVETIEREKHSRFPVFGDSIHELRGIVMSHDILQEINDDRGGRPVSSIMTSGLIVQGSMPSDKLLALFREESRHLAIVQEDGKTIGIVTLEDVLEELVGEIEDELDARE